MSRTMLGWFLACSVAVYADDEKEAVKTCDAYFAALQKSDYSAAVECLHSKSMKKMKAKSLKEMERSDEKTKLFMAETLGFKSWKELVDSDDKVFVTSLFKNSDKLVAVGETFQMFAKGKTRVIGTIKKDAMVYVVIEATFDLEGKQHILPILNIVYKDGNKWKLAHHDEPNIGKD